MWEIFGNFLRHILEIFERFFGNNLRDFWPAFWKIFLKFWEIQVFLKIFERFLEIFWEIFSMFVERLIGKLLCIFERFMFSWKYERFLEICWEIFWILLRDFLIFFLHTSWKIIVNIWEIQVFLWTPLTQTHGLFRMGSWGSWGQSDNIDI